MKTTTLSDETVDRLRAFKENRAPYCQTLSKTEAGPRGPMSPARREALYATGVELLTEVYGKPIGAHEIVKAIRLAKDLVQGGMEPRKALEKAIAETGAPLVGVVGCMRRMRGAG